MGWRVPPNKGIIEFPAILHVRVTQAMHDEVKGRGGARWVRAILEANTRPAPPAPAANTPTGVSQGKPGMSSPAKRSRRVTRRRDLPRSSKRVTLDKKKRRGV